MCIRESNIGTGGINHYGSTSQLETFNKLMNQRTAGNYPQPLTRNWLNRYSIL